MLKKLIALSSLLLILSGCNVITQSTDNTDIVEFAYSTHIGKANKSGYGYTFTAPRNSRITNDSIYSSTLQMGSTKYSIYVNIAQYLEDENLVTKTASGDYISTKNINHDESEDSESNKFLYNYRHIFIADNPNISVEENQNNAKKMLDTLMKDAAPAASFEEYAIKYSNDISTSSNGGNIGPVKASEIEESVLEKLNTLESDSIYNDIVAVEGGYDIIMLVSKFEDEKDVEEISSKNTKDVIFSTARDGFETYVIDNDNDTFNVVTKNNYISVSSIVKERNIHNALYETITTIRSIKINKDISLNSLVNPSYNIKSAELFDLNKSNSGVVSQIETEYETKFSTSLAETAEEQVVVGSNKITFDTQKITKEEYDEIVKNNSKK